MPLVWPIDRRTSLAALQQLQANVEDKLGMVPDLVATMVQSTSVARAFLGLTDGSVPAESLRERGPLTVSLPNRCASVAVHSAIRSFVLTERKFATPAIHPTTQLSAEFGSADQRGGSRK